MSVARRLAEHFVAPVEQRKDFVAPDEAPGTACAHPTARTPAGVAVLAAPADALALGAALGLALARVHRAPVVVVCVWSAGTAVAGGWRAPASRAGRRLAVALAARGHAARAAGRLVVVTLDGDAADAAAQARRALAAAGGAPAVVAIGGPRRAAFDGLLADQDLVVVGQRSGADPLLARLVVAGLGAGVRACACEIPAANPARTLAGAGLALLPSARRALAGPVAELS